VFVIVLLNKFGSKLGMTAHLDPKSAFSLLTWIAKTWLGIEALWMNVKIDNPQNKDPVTFGKISVGGSYRTLLGKHVVLFHRCGNFYYPQDSPVFGTTKGRWSGEVDVGEGDAKHSIVIAIALTDAQILQRYFGEVHRKTGQWVGIRMDSLPPGIKVLDEKEVYARKGNNG
jgi:hypothetical protein